MSNKLDDRPSFQQRQGEAGEADDMTYCGSPCTGVGRHFGGWLVSGLGVWLWRDLPNEPAKSCAPQTAVNLPLPSGRDFTISALFLARKTLGVVVAPARERHARNRLSGHQRAWPKAGAAELLFMTSVKNQRTSSTKARVMRWLAMLRTMECMKKTPGWTSVGRRNRRGKLSFSRRRHLQGIVKLTWACFKTAWCRPSYGLMTRESGGRSFS